MTHPELSSAPATLWSCGNGKAHLSRILMGGGKSDLSTK